MPPDVIWKGRTIACAPGQSVLEALEASGVEVANSCRAGACQACLLRVVSGTPPEAAQKGLKDTLKAQGYILSCQARDFAKDGDSGVLTLEEGAAGGTTISAKIVEKSHPAPGIVRLLLKGATPFAYQAGQYVHVGAVEGPAVLRSYSLASVPDDQTLELHIKKVEDGHMSVYLHDVAAVGDTLTVKGPTGDCFYIPGNPAQPLLLGGTGTGLAPLLGIARAALLAGHTGPIRLHHGARSREGLYASGVLAGLAAGHENLTYIPSVFEGEPNDETTGDIKARMAEDAKSNPTARVFLCGSPKMVNALKMKVFMAGVSMKEIYADAFVRAGAEGTPVLT